MKPPFETLLATLAIAAGLALAVAAPAAGQSPYATGEGSPADREITPFVIDHDPDGLPYVAGELLVTYREGSTGSQIAAANDRVDAETVNRFGPIDARAIEVPAILDLGSRAKRESGLEAVRRELEADPRVVTADFNYVDRIDGAGHLEPGTDLAVNDPLLPQQWGIPRIRAPQAWDRTIGENTLIGVLDSGLQISHPDIGGVVADADFVNNDPVAEDNNGHGTHVTGIAGANTNNGAGIAGASPLANILAGKVCEDNGGGIGGSASCPIAAQINGLIATADFGGVDVINMSLGGTGCPVAQKQAVDYAVSRGIVVVAAAGNDATDTPHCPAFYPNAVAVSGTDINNGDSDFSNFGSWVDIAAPGGENAAVSNGEDILSTVPISAYEFKNGTSMSTPFVAGVASLLAGQNLNRAQIRKRLEYNATDLPPRGEDVLFGHGLLNAQAAVENRACRNAQAAVQSAATAVNAAAQDAAAADRAAKQAARKAKKAKRKAKRKGTDKARRKARRAKRKAGSAKAEAGSAHEVLDDANAKLSFATGVRNTVC